MLSREHILAQLREKVHHPAGIRELLQLLKIPRDERADFKQHMTALVATGDLIQIRGQRYGLPEKMDLHVGRLQAHPAGYGFVVPDRPIDQGGDIYIANHHMNEAMHGDRVVVRIERVKEGGRVEGRVARTARQHEGLEEPGGVGQVPLHRTGVGHGLDGLVLHRQGLGQGEAPRPHRAVTGQEAGADRGGRSDGALVGACAHPAAPMHGPALCEVMQAALLRPAVK